MCGMGVSGAAGIGAGQFPPNKTSVGGDAGPGQKPGKGLSGGGPEGAVDGLGGLLAQVADAIDQVRIAVERLLGNISGGGGKDGGCGMGQVMGVRGGAAGKKETVAEVTIPVEYPEGEDHTYEQRVLDLVNQFRRSRGLSDLRYNPLLDNAAEKHANHMAGVRRMAHDGIGDGDAGGRIRAEGFGRAWGENVATGQLSPEQVVREWIASPAHLRNLIDPKFTQLGVGYVTDEYGRSYWAQEFGA